MNILISDKEVLKKYMKIWNKIKNLLKKKFDSALVYNNLYINSKINLNITDFYGNKSSVLGKNYAKF